MRSKLFLRLHRLESELEKKLIPALKRAAVGEDDLLFCVERTNPFPELRRHISERGTHLFNQANSILSLAAQLGEPTDDLLASRLVLCFEEWADVNSHHRGGTAGIARLFLKELDGSSPKEKS